MTLASVRRVRLDTKSDSDREIPWIETDPRRAPIRNDLVTALQVALAPALFWYVFFTGAYDPATAVDATAFVMLMIFPVSFIVTWARMASARRALPTIRGPRSKLRLALFIGVLFAVLSGVASLPTYQERTFGVALSVCVGISAAVIVLVLETYAVDVPRADPMYERIQRAKFDIR
jgi:hypothetical protein